MSAKPRWISVAQRVHAQSEQWEMAIRQALFDLRVATPGIVQSFDATKQTAVVQPVIRESIANPATLAAMWVPLPQLLDVPIVIPRAGNFLITVPVTAGDECLIVFADSCIDAWWERGGQQNQPFLRRHDLSDAFAVLGCWSQPNKVSDYSTEAIQIRTLDGTSIIEIDASGDVNVTAPNVNLTVTGNVTIAGKDWLTHQHTGVATGGANTGPIL